jgi:hypothetical protein
MAITSSALSDSIAKEVRRVKEKNNAVDKKVADDVAYASSKVKALAEATKLEAEAKKAVAEAKKAEAKAKIAEVKAMIAEMKAVMAEAAVESESDNESDNDSSNESDNDSSNESDNDSDNESDNDSSNESDNDSSNESDNDSSNESDNDSSNESDNDSSNESDNDSSNESSSESDNDSDNESDDEAAVANPADLDDLRNRARAAARAARNGPALLLVPNYEKYVFTFSSQGWPETLRGFKMSIEKHAINVVGKRMAVPVYEDKHGGLHKFRCGAIDSDNCVAYSDVEMTLSTVYDIPA